MSLKSGVRSIRANLPQSDYTYNSSENNDVLLKLSAALPDSTSQSFFKNLKAELTSLKNDVNKYVNQKSQSASKFDKKGSRKIYGSEHKNLETQVPNSMIKLGCPPHNAHDVTGISRQLRSSKSTRQNLQNSANSTVRTNKCGPTRQDSLAIAAKGPETDCKVSPQEPGKNASRITKQNPTPRPIDATEEVSALKLGLIHSKQACMKLQEEVNLLNGKLQCSYQEGQKQAENQRQKLEETIRLRNKQIAALTSNIKFLKEQSTMIRKDAQQQIKTLTREREALQSKIKESSCNGLDSPFESQNSESTLQSYKNKIYELEEKCKLSNEYEATLQLQITERNQEISHLKESYADQEKGTHLQIAKLKEFIEALQTSHKKQMLSLQTQYEKSAAQQQSLKYRELGHSFEQKINDFLDQNTKLKNRISSLEGTVEELGYRNKSLEETVKAYEERDENCTSTGVIEQEMETLRSNIVALEEERQKSIEDYQFKIMKLENQLDSLKNERGVDRQPVNQIIKEQINEVQKLRSLLKEKSEENSALQKKIAAMASSISQLRAK